MIFAGWEVRIVKNCDRGQHFSGPRSQFFTIQTDPRHVYIFSCSKLALQITNGFVYATLSLLNPLARRLLTICKNLRKERVIQIPDKDVLKKRYFSIYFMIVVFISPCKFSNVKFCAKPVKFFLQKQFLSVVVL